MSDYLDSLVAKNLGLEKSVLPRPFSLFEPLPFVAAPPASDRYGLEEDGAPSRGPANAERMTRGNTGPAAKAESSETQARLAPRADSSEKSAGYREPESNTVLIPHETEKPAVVRDEAGKPAECVEQTAPAPQQAVGSHMAMSKSAQGISRNAVTPAGRQLAGSREAGPLISFQKAPKDPETVPGTPPPQTLLIPPIEPRPAGDHRRGSPLPERADRIVPPPEAEREAAPTIKITIGRVDVRAVMAERPAPRPAPERRNSALSLEEYLKQRSGGKP